METTPVQTTASTATSETGATVLVLSQLHHQNLVQLQLSEMLHPNSFLQMGCQRPWTQLKWKLHQFRLQSQLLHQSKQELQSLVLSQLHHQNLVQLQLSQMLQPNSFLLLGCQRPWTQLKMETTPVQTTVSTTVTGAVTTSSPELSTATAFRDATSERFSTDGLSTALDTAEMEATPVQTTVSTPTSVKTGATVTGVVTTSSPELSTVTAFRDATSELISTDGLSTALDTTEMETAPVQTTASTATAPVWTDVAVEAVV